MLFWLLFCRFGNLIIELELEGVLGPSEGVVEDILAQDQVAHNPLFVVGDMARVVLGTSHLRVLQRLQL